MLQFHDICPNLICLLYLNKIEQKVCNAKLFCACYWIFQTIASAVSSNKRHSPCVCCIFLYISSYPSQISNVFFASTYRDNSFTQMFLEHRNTRSRFMYVDRSRNLSSRKQYEKSTSHFLEIEINSFILRRAHKYCFQMINTHYWVFF